MPAEHGSADFAVSTHSRLKAAGRRQCGWSPNRDVSTHSRLKAAGGDLRAVMHITGVSTHSRLKAAGASPLTAGGCAPTSFNTQPPKGGWGAGNERDEIVQGFNTQPPKGGWDYNKMDVQVAVLFQHTAA